MTAYQYANGMPLDVTIIDIFREASNMKRNLLVFLTFSFIFAGSVHAAFLDPGFGARPLGLGGAYTALSDDSNGAMYNPAGLSYLSRPEAGFMYAKLFYGLDNVNLGLQYGSFVCPIKRYGSIGVSYSNFVSDSQYNEAMYILSYANSISKYLDLSDPYDFSVGVNLKYLAHSYVLDPYTVNDPVFASGNSKSNYAADLGVTGIILNTDSENFTLGVVAKNINRPDMGLLDQDIVPMEFRGGVAYTISSLGFAENFILSADCGYRNQTATASENNINLAAGAESWFFKKMLALRAGGNSTSYSVGCGFSKSVSSILLKIDYSMVIPFYVQNTSGSQRLSISFGF